MIIENSEVILSVRDLTANVDETPILKGLNLEVKAGEIHAIMGPNGSGKSTFSKVLAGHPAYEVTGGEVIFRGQNLLEMEAEERARAGIFLAFQYPLEIPGVSNVDFLRVAYNSRRKAEGLEELDAFDFDELVHEKLDVVKMNPAFLSRSVNEGFSGGEKKRNEILQMALLEPKLAILDETDSGLDIDALKIVADGVNQLANAENAMLVITHYQRLLNYIVPDFVHVMEAGRIITSGGKELALELESRGYEWVREEEAAEVACKMTIQVTSIPNPEEVGLKSAATNRDAKLVELLNLSRSQELQVLDPEMVGWLQELRDRAASWLPHLKFPTTRDEEWRVTDISPLLKLSFQAAKSADVPQSAIEGLTLAEAAESRLVFVNGVYAPALSSVGNLPDGIFAGNLAQLPITYRTRIDNYFAQQKGFDEVFTLLIRQD
jgi:Fe-S cluster assembly ATP-binding protein